MDGWIKLDRAVLDSRYFSNPLELKVWVWLMCKASTVDRYASLKIGKGFQTVEVKRGQLIFGRNKAGKEMDIDPSTLYRIIQKFQSEQVINIEPNNQFSIITVNSFIESQTFTAENEMEFEEVEQPISENANNQRTTNEQATNKQRTTNEQATNTVEESLESRDSRKVEEGKERAESNGTPAAGNLFGDPEPAKNKKSRNGGNKPAAKKLTVIHMPWESPEFADSWAAWKRYKLEQLNFKYKGTDSEQAALKDLADISEGREEIAIKIIQKAMAKGWKGLFALKPEDYATAKINGNHSTQNGKSAPGLTAKDYVTSLTSRFGGSST